jgi:hypothetical protein
MASGSRACGAPRIFIPSDVPFSRLQTQKTAMKTTLKPVLTLCAFLVACGGSEQEAGMDMDHDMSTMAAEPIGTVSILEPANSADIMGRNVTVRLSVAGFPIVQAGDMTPGTGHHHLYLDADLTAATVPVPTVPGSIVHMGNGASEYTFENVAVGPHRLIAVVADGAHVPLQPWVVDTIVFTVH